MLAMTFQMGMAWSVVFIWLFFLAGQAVHTWLRASLAVRSSRNGVATYRAWFAVKAPVIAARFFVITCLFMFFEYGANTWFPNLLPQGGSPMIRVAAAGLFGYASDSLIDQFFAKMGWDKELPPPLDAQDQAQGAASGK